MVKGRAIVRGEQRDVRRITESQFQLGQDGLALPTRSFVRRGNQSVRECTLPQPRKKNL